MLKKAKILIVDDIQRNVDVLAELIDAQDIETITATNAQDALALLTDHDICLALLDVQMPDIDGFELARLIRGVNQFRSLPIIFVTATTRTEDLILEGYETGAVDVLFKPLIPQIVRTKVRVFVELYQQKQLLKDHVSELERLRIQADEANVAKGRFLANMSHEIRTPLAAVMGFSEMIAKGNLQEKERNECAQAVKRNGAMLLRLIDDILDLSKVEAEKLEFENVEFSLDEVFRDVDSNLSFRAHSKQIKLNWSYHQTFNDELFKGDPSRIKQMLLNIIGNAIKFTDKGNVNISVDAASAVQENKKRIMVTVQDQGIGLSQEQAERLFQPFSQADTSTHRRFGGSGLGLVISKRIANKMNGDVRLLAAAPGQGSTFEISFEIELADGKRRAEVIEKKTREVGIPNLADKTILVVDDSPDNLALINLFVRATNVKLIFASNGLEAVEAVKQNNLDLVVMDVQMPLMDGCTATQEIRKMGVKIPIIALTAHALASEHEKCIAAGCDGVLSKPVARERLLATLQKHLEN